MRWDSIVFLFE
jgi:ABC-type multidrug transport system fused ATPase/permease subunit